MLPDGSLERARVVSSLAWWVVLALLVVLFYARTEWLWYGVLAGLLSHAVAVVMIYSGTVGRTATFQMSAGGLFSRWVKYLGDFYGISRIRRAAGAVKCSKCGGWLEPPSGGWMVPGIVSSATRCDSCRSWTCSICWRVGFEQLTGCACGGRSFTMTPMARSEL